MFSQADQLGAPVPTNKHLDLLCEYVELTPHAGWGPVVRRAFLLPPVVLAGGSG